MMINFHYLGALTSLVMLAIPAIVLYFIIKLAVKNAIKELKEDKIL